LLLLLDCGSLPAMTRIARNDGVVVRNDGATPAMTV
jgi:hypothetical protein